MMSPNSARGAWRAWEPAAEANAAKGVKIAAPSVHPRPALWPSMTRFYLLVVREMSVGEQAIGENVCPIQHDAVASAPTLQEVLDQAMDSAYTEPSF